MVVAYLSRNIVLRQSLALNWPELFLFFQPAKYIFKGYLDTWKRAYVLLGLIFCLLYLLTYTGIFIEIFWMANLNPCDMTFSFNVYQNNHLKATIKNHDKPLY